MVDGNRIHMRGQFVTSDGGKAIIGRNPATVRKGMFLTSMPPVQRQVRVASAADAITLMTARLQDIKKALEAPIDGRKRR